jgi:enterochelin esterase-like enzyme
MPTWSKPMSLSKELRRSILAGQLLTTSLVAQSAPTTPGDDHEVLLSVTHARVPSKVFHATRDISVWLPGGTWGKEARLPVLVFPDAEEKGEFRSALANIQFLIDRQLIPPLMVLGVPYFANRTHELTPAATGSTLRDWPDAGGADQTIQFVADELLPWADAHYPTAPTRVLAGHSFGALFALYTMVNRPEIFRVVIAMSPPMGWNDGAFSREATMRLASDSVHTRTLFITSGGYEPPIVQSAPAFVAQLAAVLDTAHTHRLTFGSRRYPGDAHDVTPLTSLVEALRMAFAPLAVPIDSVVDQLSSRHAQDSAELMTIVQQLESRHAAAAAAFGIPALFPEAPLDQIGYYSLDAKHPGLAVTLLRENRDRYPQSANAHESLGEGLVAVGDTSGAVGEFHAAIAIVHTELRTPQPIITRTRQQAIAAAALAQLSALHRENAARNP